MEIAQVSDPQYWFCYFSL